MQLELTKVPKKWIALNFFSFKIYIVGGIGLHKNVVKTAFVYFNQRRDISTLYDRSLKLVNKFTYLGSSVSSTWEWHGQLSIDYQSYGCQTWNDKIKRSFLLAAVVLILLYGCTTCTLTKRMEKNLDDNDTRMLRALLNKSCRQRPTKQ